MQTLSGRASAHASTVRMHAVSGSARGVRYDTPLRPAEPLPHGVARATVTVVSGLDAGRIVPMNRDTIVIGRGDEADLTIEDGAVSRAHARIFRRADGTFQVEDLGSTNGTFVRGRRVMIACLAEGDHVQLGPRALLRFDLTDPADEQLQAHLYESSIRDPLTGAFNRRYLENRIVAEVAHARRQAAPFAVIMLDVDHFKLVNDRHGHFVGDRVLGIVTAQIARNLRGGDVLVRFGGDEFVVLCRDAHASEAVALAERLRTAMASMHLSAGGGSVSITLSIGVASLDEIGDGEPAGALLALADDRLFAAKAEGRNRVCAV
jgi:diguanylate cyclase (GGDEF)-like protein